MSTTPPSRKPIPERICLHTDRLAPRGAAGLAVTMVAGLLPGCADVPRADDDAVVIAQETQAAWSRNFNPFLPAGAARWPTRGGIHEPLLIHDRVGGAWIPWLATESRWDDPTTLRFVLRPDVRWSDGEKFTAADVVYTFELMQRFPALDSLGLSRWLASVEPDGGDVVFRFTRPYAPGLEDIAETPIVPAHTWADVVDPVAWTDPEPVGTGPYTEVLTFTSQLWELGANPYAWTAHPNAPSALRFPAFAGNDAANLALANGEVDWAGNFVPAVDRTFVAGDPAHRVAWSPPVESTVYLYANTTRAPFGDVRARQALSHAIDRDRLVTVAMDGLTRPADATGLSDALSAFRDPSVRAAWTHHDPDAARALLDLTGYPEAPPTELLVVSGWSDWVRAANLVAHDLAEVGIPVRVRPIEFSAWLDRVQHGDFALTIGWSTQGATPYAGYRDLMGSASFRPIGQAAAGNWHRYASPRADRLLAAVEANADPEVQAALFRELQLVFAEELPAIPLFPGPAWGAANTARFIGFPSAADPWATLSPNRSPESLRVLSALETR